MKLARLIWPLNVAGATAAANLACMTLLGVLYLCLYSRFFPAGFVRVDLDPRWKQAVVDVLTFGMIFLAFPAGWVGHFSGYPWGALAFVPLNAYFWGAISHATWRSRIQVARSKHVLLHACSNDSCSVHFTVDLKHCPACGTPGPEQIQGPIEQIGSPTRDKRRPSALFILTAGVAAPTLCGSVTLLSVYLFGEDAVRIGAVLTGATFVALVIRWFNRRDTAARKS